jgi:hypothetical protein
MGIYDEYRARCSANGGSVKSAIKNNSIYMFDSLLPNSPFYKTVTINSESVGGIVEDTDSYDKKFLLLSLSITNDEDEIVSVDIGDIVTIDGEYWLIINYKNNGVYRRYELDYCNKILKWLNLGLVKQSYAVITKYSNFSTRYKDAYGIALPDGMLHVYIPNNDSTSTIEYGNRFIISGQAFKVVGIKNIIKNITQLSLEIDQIEENDDLTLEIADYLSLNYVLNILNGSSVDIIKDNSLQLSVELLNGDVPILGQTFTYTSSDSDICTVDEEGLISAIEVGEVTITVEWEDCSDSIEINVLSSVENNYLVSIEGDTSMRIQQSKSFVVKVYNNGVLEEKDVVWSLTNSDDSTPCDYASITSYDDQNCTVCADETSGVSIKLVATLDDDEDIFGFKNITIKGLFG